MSLFESMESNGTVSLRSLFEGNQDIEGLSDLSIEDIAFALCRGGGLQALNCRAMLHYEWQWIMWKQ